MSEFKKQFARGAVSTVLARIVEAAAIFARNLVLANMLGAANQGVAAVFAITMSFLDMLSDLGAGRLIVQDDDGDGEAFQASLQTAELLRGMLIGLVLYLGAPSLSVFFNTPQAEWAFRVLALMPVIRGFQHLDTRRYQRRMHFGRYVATSIIPQVLTAVLAYPLAFWIKNYSAALYLIILQTLASVILSHLLADRPYKLGMTRDHMKRILNFGGPFLLNSILLFATLQGDRTIVGRFYDSVELGIFSTAIALAMTASSVAMSIVTPLALPSLTLVKNQESNFVTRYANLNEISLLCSMAIAVGFIVLGPNVIETVYNNQYMPAMSFIGVMGVSAALRTLRIVPNAAQMARGDNMGIFYCNLFRTTGVIAAVICAFNGLSLVIICWCGVAGECVSLAGTAILLRRRQNLQERSLFTSLLLFWCSVVSAFFIRWTMTPLDKNLIIQWVVGTLAVAMIIVVAAATRTTVRSHLYDLLRVRMSASPAGQ